MGNLALEVTGVLVIIAIFAAAYFVLGPVLAAPNIQSTLLGRVLSQTLALWCGLGALIFSVVLLSVAPKGLNPK